MANADQVQMYLEPSSILIHALGLSDVLAGGTSRKVERWKFCGGQGGRESQTHVANGFLEIRILMPHRVQG
jgi:hypothetical protein